MSDYHNFNKSNVAVDKMFSVCTWWGCERERERERVENKIKSRMKIYRSRLDLMFF